MRLIGAAAAALAMCAAGVSAQEIKTTTKERTKFEVKDGKDMTVTGCLARFEDAGYMLTTDAGELEYVLVTKDNLSKYTGHRVEVKGVGTPDGTDAKIRIEKEVGTSGEIDGKKVEPEKTKKVTEVTGDVGFPYLSVKSIKKISNACR
jgi:hypothetical protein